MKLIYCTECQDVVRLFEFWRWCKCERVCGRYVDDLNVQVSGNAVVMGVDNHDINWALKQGLPETGRGPDIGAWFFSKDFDRIERFELQVGDVCPNCDSWLGAYSNKGETHLWCNECEWELRV